MFTAVYSLYLGSVTVNSRCKEAVLPFTAVMRFTAMRWLPGTISGMLDVIRNCIPLRFALLVGQVCMSSVISYLHTIADCCLQAACMRIRMKHASYHGGRGNATVRSQASYHV